MHLLSAHPLADIHERTLSSFCIPSRNPSKHGHLETDATRMLKKSAEVALNETETIPFSRRDYAQLPPYDCVLDCLETPPRTAQDDHSAAARPHETFNDGTHHLSSYPSRCHYWQFRSLITDLDDFPQTSIPWTKEKSLLCGPSYSIGARLAYSGRICNSPTR